MYQLFGKKLMIPLKQQTLYFDLWKHIQKETHFTGRQMYKNFPELFELISKEGCLNVTIGINTYRRRFMFNDRKKVNQ